MNNSLKIVASQKKIYFTKTFCFFLFLKLKLKQDELGFLQGSFAEMLIKKVIFIVAIHCKYLCHALSAMASLCRHLPSLRLHNEAQRIRT